MKTCTLVCRFYGLVTDVTIADAQANSSIQVAESVKRGNVGQAEREGETRQRKAEIEQKAVHIENEKQQQIVESRTKLAILTSEMKQKEEIAAIQARMASKEKDIELMQKLEQKRQEQEKETIRANMSSKANVQAEILDITAQGVAKALITEADGKREALERTTNGLKYQIENEAKMQRVAAEQKITAQRFGVEQQAAADLEMISKQAQGQERLAMAKYVMAQQEAKGILELANANFQREAKEAEALRLKLSAEADGLDKVYKALGSNDQNMRWKIGVDASVPQAFAKSNADALQGLNPKININQWQVGSGKDGHDLTALQQVLTQIPPVAHFFNESNLKIPGFVEDFLGMLGKNRVDKKENTHVSPDVIEIKT